MLKRQEVLQDGSTLEEQGITDGSTVNILIEPDECINVNVKCCPKTYTKEISKSMTVNELKIDLIKSNQVAFPLHQFELAKLVPKDGSDDTGRYTAKLEDEDLPLHHYGIQTHTNLTVISPFIMIKILSINGEYLYKHVQKHMTFSQLKSKILLVQGYYTFGYHDIIMFVKRGSDTYVELDPKTKYSVGEVLAEDDTLYLTADMFFKSYYPLYYNGSEIGKIGIAYEESVLNLKLWTQVQTGIPVSNIRVLGSPPPKRFPFPVKSEKNQSAIPRNNQLNQNSNQINGGTSDLKDNVKIQGYNEHYIEIF